MSLRRARWSWIEALFVVVVGIVLSPLRAVAATVPMLIAYDSAARPTTATGVGTCDAVGREAEYPSINAYVAGDRSYGGASNPHVACGSGAVHAYDDALEHADRREGPIYAAPHPTAAAEGLEGGGMAAVRALGTDGEAAANIIKNTERIESASGTANYRIPDVLDHDLNIIGEVKNVGSLSYTNQLRDFSSYAQANGYTFQLMVRSTTQLSGPLQQAVNAGDIMLLRTLP
jgi:hypothetical protein